MDLYPHWCGRRPSGPRLPATGSRMPAGSRCVCHSNGLHKPPVFFRPSDRRNTGVAHLATAKASLMRQQVSGRGDCVFGGFLQPPSNGFSNGHWALITALTP